MKLKTITQVVREHPEYERLIRAVVRTIGTDSIEDVINHGAMGGVSGFIYHHETNKFFKTHREQIMALAKDSAEQFGESMFTMIKNFNIFRDMKVTEDEIAESLYADRGEMNVQIRNAMAWFALEEVCRMFEE